MCYKKKVNQLQLMTGRCRSCKATWALVLSGLKASEKENFNPDNNERKLGEDLGLDQAKS